ncbi:hypothetical protein ACTXT7_016271 [Hymenolepis weldensis]
MSSVEHIADPCLHPERRHTSINASTNIDSKEFDTLSYAENLPQRLANYEEAEAGVNSSGRK